MSIAKAALDGIWNNIDTACDGVTLRSPTEESTFKVAEVKQDRIVITLKDELSIDRQAFEGALHYLVSHGHNSASPCEIRSNTMYEAAGPLCRSARKAPNGQRNITYVLPILKQMGLVGIGPERPSTAWFIA